MKLYTNKWTIASEKEKGSANNNINWKKKQRRQRKWQFYSNISSLIFRKRNTKYPRLTQIKA